MGTRLNIVIALFAMASLASGLCWPWQSPGVIILYKHEHLGGEARAVGSVNTCINLEGGPYISGKAAGGYTCHVYSRLACNGDSNAVDHGGLNKFAFHAESIRCPCQ